MATTKQTTPVQPDTTVDSDGKDDSLDVVLKAFDKAWEYTNGSWHQRWQDNYKLYNNERVKYGYVGISDTFVPMTFGTVETLCSALFGTKPKFNYVPPQDHQNQNTNILNSLIDYYWDKDQWSVKIINTGRGFLREGTAVDYFCWEMDHPRLINVPIRDFFIDPNAFELDESSTKYCGRRYLTDLETLESYEVLDLDAKPDEHGNYPMKPKYEDLDKLKGSSVEEPVTGTTQYQDQTTDKEEKDMYYGSTLGEPEKDQIEVIEYWTVDKTISVANRQVVIEDVENYFKTQDAKQGNKFPQGILPFSAARDYVDGSLFYAKSEVDFIADQQEDLNDISNQNKDAISFALNQMKTLHPKYAHMLKEIQNLPGAIYPMEPDMLVPIPNGTIPVEAFAERQNIKAEIRETTASNEVIKGAANTGPGAGTETATAINAQIAGAGQRISLKVTQIENEYFHRVAKIVFKMIQLYVTEPMMVQIMGKDGASWQQFNPDEFKGEYEPRVQLDISIQQQEQQDATNAANLLKAFLNDPNVNQQELTKLVLQKGFNLDPDEVQLLVTPVGATPGADPASADNPLAALMGGAGAAPAQPPIPGAPGQTAPTAPPPKLPSESITFKDAVAAGAIDSAAAMLNQAGLPSQDIQQQRPAPGQVIGGQVQQPQSPDPNQAPQELPDNLPTGTDIIPHPQTGEPVMAGQVG